MKRGDLIRCRDCHEQTIWRRTLLPEGWVVVNDEPAYALCLPCHAAVVRSALGRLA